MVNRGDDGYYPVSVAVEDPENPGKAIYPDGDYCWDVLRPIYEAYGVNAVNFGHSHVYERYLINGVNYIEAASIGNNYRNTADPMHFSGNEPIIEENNFRSFMRVTVRRARHDWRGHPGQRGESPTWRPRSATAAASSRRSRSRSRRAGRRAPAGGVLAGARWRGAGRLRLCGRSRAGWRAGVAAVRADSCLISENAGRQTEKCLVAKINL